MVWAWVHLPGGAAVVNKSGETAVTLISPSARPLHRGEKTTLMGVAGVGFEDAP